jgi:3-oxoacyl-[acyl-carrier-protein] synthase-1
VNSPVAILSTGLTTAVGSSSPATCAAIRASVANPTLTRFIDSSGKWIQAQQVAQVPAGRGIIKLASMACAAIVEALVDIPRSEWGTIPLLLCVAEQDRPGRVAKLDTDLFPAIQRELGTQFAADSAIIAHGRVSAAVAISQARKLLYQQGRPMVLIVATDSLVSWPTLSSYERAGRLLTQRNSNGFIPGEGAGALLVGRPRTHSEMICWGLGFAVESANIQSDQPLRADGLTLAVKTALGEAGWAMHDVDYRVTDLSGEQFYFKEAALALTRLLRQHKEELDLWHPAEILGETGALSGVSSIAVAEAASRKGYSRGPRVLVHMSNDSGARAALTLQATERA